VAATLPASIEVGSSLSTMPLKHPRPSAQPNAHSEIGRMRATASPRSEARAPHPPR
jgi:hypothetical protein